MTPDHRNSERMQSGANNKKDEDNTANVNIRNNDYSASQKFTQELSGIL